MTENHGRFCYDYVETALYKKEPILTLILCPARAIDKREDAEFLEQGYSEVHKWQTGCNDNAQ